MAAPIAWLVLALLFVAVVAAVVAFAANSDRQKAKGACSLCNNARASVKAAEPRNHGLETPPRVMFPTFDAKQGTVPAIFINLATRADRKRELEAELAHTNLELHRLDAVTSEREAWVSCTCSHVKALRLAEESTVGPVVLILEDDAMFNHNITGKDITAMLAGLQAVPDTWDVVTLAPSCVTYTKEADAHGVPGMRVVQSSLSCAALLVRREYLPTMRAVAEEACKAGAGGGELNDHIIDVAYRRELQPSGRWLAFSPTIMVQRPSYSNIQGSVQDYTPFFDTG